MRALALSVAAAALGVGLGYGAALVSRILGLIFLEAALVGLLGGAALLLVALLFGVRSLAAAAFACFLLAVAGWGGQRLGDYRYDRRAAVIAGGDPAIAMLTAEERAALFEPTDLAARRAAAAEAFDADLVARTGRAGLWGHVQARWTEGVVVARAFGWSARAPLPPIAVALGQAASALASMGLAWLALRRLAWVARCAACGRLLDDDELDAARCAECVSAPS